MRNKILIVIGAILALFGFLLPIILLKFKSFLMDISGLNNLAEVGDFLGGSMTGILTFSSIILIITTIGMQKEELKIQLEEIQNNNNILKQQQFEMAFFNNFKYYREEQIICDYLVENKFFDK